jgi:hypothetical protein
MDVDEFEVEINILRDQAIALFKRADEIAKPFFDSPIEKVKKDFVREITREEANSSPLTKQGALDLINLMDQQLHFYSGLTVEPSVFSMGRRVAYVGEANARQLEILKDQIKDLGEKCRELRDAWVKVDWPPAAR